MSSAITMVISIGIILNKTTAAPSQPLKAYSKKLKAMKAV
jgi:hypothetical protein